MAKIISKFTMISLLLMPATALSYYCSCFETCQQLEQRLQQRLYNVMIYHNNLLWQQQQFIMYQLELSKSRQTLPIKEPQLLAKSHNLASACSKKLIVVSLSTGLKDKQRIIIDSLFDVFSDLKTSKSKTPFDLLTLQSGRELHKLLTDQELQSLAIEGEKDSLLSRIETTINFGATGLSALEDLSLVDTKIQEQPSIGNILYLTDNTKMSENPKEIPSKQRGVPLVWHKDGIALTVLTTKQCQVWKYVGAKCTSWQNQTDFKQQLNAFIQQ